MADTAHTILQQSCPQSVDAKIDSDEKVFDKAELLQRAGGDVDIADEILALCPGELAKMLHELESAVTQQDLEQVQRIAHRLKGTLGNLGAARAFEMTQHLEELAGNGALGQVENQFPAFRIQVERVRLAIETANDEGKSTSQPNSRTTTGHISCGN
ncbi:MAG: Hpt domain-containing protein [Planctomycetota bacterium]|nr:Hpt domain-containing protein [Planctomycetota bacterium]MDA1178378.1 Hpt domain-containing protein [Planctomycetota bacterium]